MGQAKQRGTYEERKAAAIQDNGGVERPKRLTAFERRQIQRQALREACALWANPLRGYFERW